jgi:hypothetical protein
MNAATGSQPPQLLAKTCLPTQPMKRTKPELSSNAAPADTIPDLSHMTMPSVH